MADHNKDSAKSKAEQEYMERLAKEFSSLPDRELPQGESSGTSRTFSHPLFDSYDHQCLPSIKLGQNHLQPRFLVIVARIANAKHPQK